MNGSFQLGTAFGIPIRVHWSFPLILLFLSGRGGSLGLFLAFALFGCVLLHELGHSLVARSFGIRVMDITFWPLGGMARMSAMPEDSRIEALIAIAGPAVNFVLAALGTVLTVLAGQTFLQPNFLTDFLPVFVGMNLMLGIFNLVPAFPMDGGRILRSWFARNRDWVGATERAVAVGRVIAGAMLFGSLALMFAAPQYVCAMPLIALFVWIAGGQELAVVRLRHGLPPFGASLFGFGGAPRPPWSGSGPRRPEPRADAPPPAPRHEPPAAEGARRPGAWELGSEEPGHGFDEEAIRRLERYRGRLRRPDRDA